MSSSYLYGFTNFEEMCPQDTFRTYNEELEPVENEFNIGEDYYLQILSNGEQFGAPQSTQMLESWSFPITSFNHDAFGRLQHSEYTNTPSEYSDYMSESERGVSARSSVVSLSSPEMPSSQRQSKGQSFVVSYQQVTANQLQLYEFGNLKRHSVDLGSVRPSLVEQLKSKYSGAELSAKSKSPYQCSHCNRDFATIIDLAIHFDRCKITTAHKCPFEACPFQYVGFSRKADLRRHCLTKHFEKGKLNERINLDVKHILKSLIYSCNYENCGKNFYRKDSLQRHMKLVHDNENSKFNKKLKKLLKQGKCHKSHEHYLR